MTSNLPDEKLVYLALRNTFQGLDAQVRRPKKVREFVQRDQNKLDVKGLLQKHNLDNVCDVAKTLLEQQVFEFTSKAKTRFPDLFKISPAQSVNRAASEAEAARSQADAIKSVTAGPSEQLPRKSDEKAPGKAREAPLDCTEHSPARSQGQLTVKNVAGPKADVHLRKHSCIDSIAHVPSLYPVYLPYQTQHQLLSTVQTILEEACYEFALRELKEMVEREGWDCPECIELNVWARTFLSHQHLFRQEDLEQLGKPFSALSEAISHLRHTAVHRLHISAKALEQFLVDAESLARILNDDKRMHQLIQLRRETQCTLAELERNKDLLESKLRIQLQQISEQRARLEQLETSAVDEMLKHDKTYEKLAGAALDEVIRSVVEPRYSTCSADVQLTSEVELRHSTGSIDVRSSSEVELKHSTDSAGVRSSSEVELRHSTDSAGVRLRSEVEPDTSLVSNSLSEHGLEPYVEVMAGS